MDRSCLSVLITKNTDFELSYEPGRGLPWLPLITTGNIHNDEQPALFAQHDEALVLLLNQHAFIELSRGQLIIHK